MIKKGSNPISFLMITKGSIDNSITKDLNEGERYNILCNLTTIHLEWQEIDEINKLDIFNKL